MTLREYVIAAMKEQKLSAQAVARNSNGQITGSYVTRILRDEVKRPSVQKLKGLADGLNKPHEEVLRAAGGVPKTEEAIANLQFKFSHYDDLALIFSHLLKFSPAQISRVKQFVLKINQ